MKTVMTAYGENRPCAISRHSCHLAFTDQQKIKSAELYLGIDVQDALAASENSDILTAIGALLGKRPAITGRCSNLSVRLIFSGHLVS